MKLLMLVLIFLCIGAFFIISENQLALVKEGNLNRFVSLYFSWLSTTSSNFINLTGHVINMDWLPS